MKKKIFITGISSSIIQKLALLIDLSKYDIIGVSRNPSSVQIQGIKVIEGDILEFHKISHILEGCYMVIHGAAITHSRDEKEYFNVNVIATEKIIESAKKHKVERFVYISSNTAGKESGTYGYTKLLAEQHIQKEINNWIILRPSEIFGSGKGEGIDKLLNDCLHKSVVLCPTNVPTKLCPIYIDDAVNLMFNHTFNDSILNTISVINGNEKFSYLEIIELTKKISKKKITVLFLSKRFMYFVKWVAKISPINIGIVPDQVDRLYAVKAIEPNKNPLLKLEEYIKRLVIV